MLLAIPLLLRRSIEHNLCFGNAFENQHYYKNTVITKEIAGFPYNTIQTINLSVHADKVTEIDTSFCSNHPFAAGIPIGNHGTIRHEFQTQNGCDSTIVLNFEVIDIPDVQFSDWICTGDTLFIRDTFITEAGSHRWVETQNEFCNPNIIVDLGIYPIDTNRLSISLASGDLHNNIPIFNDTSFIEIFENSNGCDSIVITKVIVQTSNIQEVLKTNSLSLYPNPADDELKADFDIKSSTKLRFQIINSLGEVVLNRTNQKPYQPGKYTMNFELNSLSNGVYFLRFIAEKGVIERSFIKH